MRRIALALSLGLALGLGACSSDSTAPTGSVVGTYSLQRINGSPLPYTFPGGSTITADQMTLNADGTYTDIVQYSGGGATTEHGQYSATSGDISFSYYDTANARYVSYQGSVSGTVLTTFINTYTSVYQKN
jgi:hypothetical protein